MAAALADRRPFPMASPVALPASILSRHSSAHSHYPWLAPGRPRSLRRALKPNCFCRLHHFPHFSVKRESERNNQSIAIRMPYNNYNKCGGGTGVQCAQALPVPKPKTDVSCSFCLQSSSGDDYTTHTESVVENK